MFELMERDRIDFGWMYYAWSGIEGELRGLDLDAVMLMDYLDCIPDYYTPILINDLVEIMVKLLAAEATGVYHVAGGERLSKFAFAHKLAAVFGLPTDTIREISVDDFSFKAARPKDMSLDCGKVEDMLGEDMPMAEEGLQRLKQLGDEGWPLASPRTI